MESFIQYYIMNIVIWGFFLRWQLFVRQDIRTEMIERLEVPEEEVDEVTQMINQREQENLERSKAEEAAKK